MIFLGVLGIPDLLNYVFAKDLPITVVYITKKFQNNKIFIEMKLEKWNKYIHTITINVNEDEYIIIYNFPVVMKKKTDQFLIVIKKY